MGSRGAFENVDLGNFHFKEGGQNYHSVGEVDGIQVIIQDSGSVKAPEFSHTANRSYAIVQNGKLKHLTFYDETHSQVGFASQSVLLRCTLHDKSRGHKC